MDECFEAKYGLRITPAVVEFTENKKREVNVIVRNISINSTAVRFYPPSSQNFQLKVKSTEKVLAPGLSTQLTLVYTKGKVDSYEEDRFCVSCKEGDIEVQLIAFPPKCVLSVSKQVDFGCLIADNRVVSRNIRVTNDGDKEGEFKVKYTGPNSLTIHPKQGIVQPHSTQIIKINFCATVPGNVKECLRVTLDKMGTMNVVLLANVVEQRLELLHSETFEPMKKVTFGSCYYGCDLIQVGILKNQGPTSVKFVAVMEEDTVGQEIDGDLTEPANVTLIKKLEKKQGCSNALTNLITIIPNQGTLGPNEKVLVTFLFKPRWEIPDKGWQFKREPPLRRDFAIFVQFQVVGKQHYTNEGNSGQQEENKHSPNVEVAITGTALPVLLSLSPDHDKIDFGSCWVGDKIDATYLLANRSLVLPVNYYFKRNAHFKATPENGSLQSKSEQQITFSFVPKQTGEFHSKKVFEVYEKVTLIEEKNLPEKGKRSVSSLDYYSVTKRKIIFAKEIHFYGMAKLNPVIKPPKFNTGITPYITNEVGLLADIKFSEVALAPRNTRASLCASKLLQVGRLTRSADLVRSLVAFPNDRAQSLRPLEENAIYRNLFNKELRYTYTDMDYMYTQQESKDVQKNRENYKIMVTEITKKKIARIERNNFNATNNEIDLGLTRAAGLKPKTLQIKDVRKAVQGGGRKSLDEDRKLFSTKELIHNQLDATLMQISQGLNAIPTTQKEKVDCAKELRPTELHLLSIGPPKIDYGKVCTKSRNTKNLIVVNNLAINILIVAQMGCEELRRSCPLSQVVPPHCKAAIPIVFESDIKGQFSKSITYTINGSYENHICVLAEVVPVALELTCPLPLIVTPVLGLMPESAFSSIVTLSNKLNYPAAFTWAPNATEKMTAFTIRPMQGVIEDYQELDCEVLWTPGYLSPDTGSFRLDVLGGNTIQFQCKAQLGSTNVHFLERRLALINCPVNLTTYGTATLVNTGNNHAYFQVVDTKPVEGMTITPVTGIIPVGGERELQLSFTPTFLLKFDFNLEVAIRNWRNLVLRVGGSVENPCIEINVPSFTFGGVCCGSGAYIDFTITNQNSALSRVDFDLSSYGDFLFSFDSHQTEEEYRFETANPGMYSLTLKGNQVIHAKMFFQPTELAAYDFIMPVYINHMSAPTPMSTSTPSITSPSTPTSSQHLFTPRQSPANIITPRKRVIATGLRSVIDISRYQVIFEFSDIHDGRITPSSKGMCQDVRIDNHTDEMLRWDLDLSIESAALEDGIVHFVHETGVPLESSKDGFVGSVVPGKGSKVFRIICQPKTYSNYEFSVPLFIRGDFRKAYKHLSVLVNMKSPKVTFNPSIIYICVPLMIEHMKTVEILSINYPSPLLLNVQCPEVECEDGSLMKPITVTFPKNTENTEDDSIGTKTLTCQVMFMSDKPMSFRKSIIFCDQYDNRFYLSVVATADNSLLTCYGFLANHQQDYHIVCAPGTTLKGQKSSSDESIDTGEAVCVPYHISLGCPSESSTRSSSSNFQMNSPTVSEMPLTSEKRSDSGYGDQEKDRNESSSPSTSESKSSSSACQVESNIFPEHDKKVGPYHQNVLNAVQRWFSANGWPGGTYPVSIPYTFRTCIGVRDGEKLQRAQNSKREPMTIYHCVKYLTGRPLPGINGIPTIPTHPIERVRQIHSQHSFLLMFLRCQCACVASIKPEYLMEYPDFLLWKKLEMQEMAGRNTEESIDNENYLMDQDVFELVSKRAWLDTLLQIIRCLVMSKITPRVLKNTPTPDKNLKMPAVNTDRLCSNIYSSSERILLAWINRSYEFYRDKIWSAKNEVLPAARWVVNFDFDLNDGLVIGTLIGAYLPFLVQSHIRKMITFPMTHEHYLHNSLKVVSSLRSVGIDYDIQAMDITDPNPIHMLLFCAHLFQVLPQYIPKSTVEFVGDLTQTITKQIKLSNPSAKAVNYAVSIIGDDAENFNLPKGNSITIQPKHSTQLTIVYHNRFLRPNYTTLILTGRRFGSGLGANIAFSLVTETSNIIPQNIQSAESPCYELLSIPLEVLNPFNTSGEFALSLVEGMSSQNNKKKCASKGLTRYSSHRLGTEMNVDHGSGHNFIVKSFHCRRKKMYFEGSKKQTVDISFLPFAIGTVQCSVIFSNTKLGDFVYDIRGTSTRPLPFPVTKKNEENIFVPSAFINNSSQANKKNVSYWRCEVGQTLSQSLWIPVINSSKERALLQVAKLQMSDLEYNRRFLTGTLDSSARAAEVFIQIRNYSDVFKQNQLPYQEFTIEHDFKYFTAPRTLQIPLCSAVTGSCPDVSTQCVELPLVFQGETPGHYDCQLLLKSVGDIRLYQIECTATPECGRTYIEFVTPVLQKCTQDIPIINPTNHDWNVKVNIIGEAFTGPMELFVPAKGTTDYALTYQPTMEDDTEGQMIMSEGDETDQIYYLRGHATEPLALGEITIDSEVRGKTKRILRVPNPTKRRLMYETHSNLPFLSGPDHISVSSGQIGLYHLDVVPIKCGTFEGVINFVAGKNVFREVDSDGDEAYGSDEGSEEYYGYRVWYILKVHVKAGPPVGIINITCPCQKKTLIDVNVTNPTNYDLTLQVTILGPDLKGSSCLFVKAGQKLVYNLTFAPSVILNKVGSLRFFNEHIGEFWYELNLKSEPPAIIELPTMECKLGMSISQNIVLINNSDETWEMFPIITDKSFRLSEYPEEKWPIMLNPTSSLSIELTFAPSTLAQTEPRCDITFACKQQGIISYSVTGCVLLPSKNPPITFYSVTGQSNGGIVKFYNPLDEIVYVNLKLKGENETEEEGKYNAKLFLINLSQKDSIVLSPHQTLDIPVLFSPNDRNTCHVECVVSVHQTNTSLQLTDGTLPSIDWCFPLIGIPEFVHINQMPVTSLSCKMRKKLKTQLQIKVNLNLETKENIISAQVLNPEHFIQDRYKEDKSIPEISYEFQFPNQQTRFDLENIVTMKLIKCNKESNSSNIKLIFGIEFFPKKCIEQCAHLVIFKKLGCLWRFPILFSSGDPDIDDVIRIEAKAMYKMVTVNFFLKAPATYPQKFVTRLTSSSDPEISVSPHEGEFNPVRVRGTRFRVHYNPTAYGQKKYALLYIQTDRIQWTYSIEASLPQYKPPIGKSLYAKDVLQPIPKKQTEQANFIAENRHVITTAVSSPLKGAPILRHIFEKKTKK